MTRKTAELYERARALIPGGTQLVSKRPETFLPEQWPAYYQRARGVELEDLDGRQLIDVSIHAVGACPLGFADPDVDAAVIAAIRRGSVSTPNCPEDVELAERLCDLHPWAEQVRYTRSGGEAMAVAVRIARAATNRDRVAVCGYHGWHDWYLAANLADPSALDSHWLPGVEPAGVPSVLRGTTVAFDYGDIQAIDRMAAENGDQLAAIVLEPAHHRLPPQGYLEHVAQVGRRTGAVLIFDEITSGFRLAIGGAHQTLGTDPDVAVFAKAMSNGYPMGAVIGRRAVMEAASRSFISSTHWSERLGPCAALATIDKLERKNAPTHLSRIGERMRTGWLERAKKHELTITTGGIPPLPTFRFEHGEDCGALATLYTQKMLDQGFLAFGAFYASLAHDSHLDAALEATDRAFAALREALDRGTVNESLRGPLAHSGSRQTRS